MNEIGHKESKGKRQWTLLPFAALREVVDVLTVNAETKYARNNWSLVEDGTTKYMDATLRHIDAWLTGEKKDPEDGKSHLAHAICDLLFALWFELTGKEKSAKTEALQPGLAAHPLRNWTDAELAAALLSMTEQEKMQASRWLPTDKVVFRYMGLELTIEDMLVLQRLIKEERQHK